MENINLAISTEDVQMNQRTLNINREKVRKFVEDFNKLFVELEVCLKDYEDHIDGLKCWRKYFPSMYPEIFSEVAEVDDDMETEVERSNPMTMEEKLRRVEEKLLSKRSTSSFTNYDGIMEDTNLSVAEKLIKLREAFDDATRRKIHFASLQGQLLESCFAESKELYKETLEKANIRRQWGQFLRKLYKIVDKYNSVLFCTVPLSYIHTNFKLIETICERDPENWKW